MYSSLEKTCQPVFSRSDWLLKVSYCGLFGFLNICPRILTGCLSFLAATDKMISVSCRLNPAAWEQDICQMGNFLPGQKGWKGILRIPGA
jgi:hypothetical protein